MAQRQQASGSVVKLLLELGPLAVFFFANAKGAALTARFPALAALGGPIFVATAAFMVAIAVALAASLMRDGRLPVMPLVSGVVVFVFGALTLWLQDDTFIKMKPTIVNLLFGGALLGGLAFGKPLLGHVFGEAFSLTPAGWRILTKRWGLFFLFLAVLNEAVWRSVSTDMWVDFKVFGIMPVTLVFAIAQTPLLRRHAPEDEA
ncbi:septation protein A [Oleispirillum naphthae]|uniref:septation protein A n=1 Tax=Oleispirillum naphthae TaxID=2838853 RepID=UPI0030826B0C